MNLDGVGTCYAEGNLIIFYLKILAYVLGTQKNRYIETVLLSTHIICFDWEIRKAVFCYALLSEGLSVNYPSYEGHKMYCKFGKFYFREKP